MTLKKMFSVYTEQDSVCDTSVCVYTEQDRLSEKLKSEGKKTTFSLAFSKPVCHILIAVRLSYLPETPNCISEAFKMIT